MKSFIVGIKIGLEQWVLCSVAGFSPFITKLSVINKLDDVVFQMAGFKVDFLIQQ